MVVGTKLQLCKNGIPVNSAATCSMIAENDHFDFSKVFTARKHWSCQSTVICVCHKLLLCPNGWS